MSNRKLTPYEMDSLLDEVIPLENNPLFVQKDLVAKREMLQNIRENFREQLRYLDVPIDGLDMLKEMITQKIIKSLSQPGFMVGITVAESFGQEVSQAALNSKRLTGAGNDISGGLNAVNSVLNGAKGAIMPATVFFTNPYFTVFDIYRMASHFTYLTLQRLTKYSELLRAKDVEEPHWLPLHKAIYGPPKFEPDYIIRVYFNMELFYWYQVNVADILKTILASNEKDMLYPVFSPLYVDEPYMDIYLNDEKLNNDVTKSAEIFYSTIFKIKDIRIKGIPDLLKMVPAHVPLTNCIVKSVAVKVSNEDVDLIKKAGGKKKMLDALFYIELKTMYMEKYGIPRKKMIELMEACGMEIMPTTVEDDRFLVVKSEAGDPKAVLGQKISEATKEQELLFRQAIANGETRIPALNDIYKLSKQYYCQIKMDKKKDKILKVLAPLSHYKIIDIGRSTAGDLYENLDTLGVVALKNYLTDTLAALIKGANGYPIWMHVNIMTNYMTHQSGLTRFNLKGVEQGPGGVLSAIQWKDHMRLITRSAATGTTAEQGSLAIYKMFNGGIAAGSRISEMVSREYTEEELEQVEKAARSGGMWDKGMGGMWDKGMGGKGKEKEVEDFVPLTKTQPFGGEGEGEKEGEGERAKVKKRQVRRKKKADLDV